MTELKDGGPAFPMPSGQEPRVDQVTHYNEGMSLRDWFAGLAMQGMLSNSEVGARGVSISGNPTSINVAAYMVADGMLDARKNI